MKKKVVQLNEEDHKTVRKHTDKITKSFGVVADMVFSKLEMEKLPLGPKGIVEIRFRPNNQKTTFYSSDGLSGGTRLVAVHEDPPGICREPTREELANDHP